MSEADFEQRQRRSGPSSGSFKVARVQVQELAAVAGPQVLEAGATDLLSDELVLDRLLAGELPLYEVLMRRVGARMFRLARGICGSETGAESIVRQSFLQAFANLGTFDRRLRFSDWLARVTIHGALDWLRRSPARPPAGPRPSRELARQLEDAVDQLPAAFRVPFTLCVLDSIPASDAASVLGSEAETVQRRAYRGRLQVRRRLGMRFDDVEASAFGMPLGRLDALVADVMRRLVDSA